MNIAALNMQKKHLRMKGENDEIIPPANAYAGASWDKLVCQSVLVLVGINRQINR